jgi:hypothetical protein
MKTARGLFFGLIAVLLSTGIVSAVVDITWGVATVSSPAEKIIEDLIQQEHTRVCGEPLILSSKLDWSARYKAMDMGMHQAMTHLDNDGKMQWEFYAVEGIKYVHAGENIAWNNYPDDQSPEVAFNGWMNSAGHRAIIQECDFTWVGVGAYKTIEDDVSGGTCSPDGGLCGHWYVAEFIRPPG